jgi:biotin carboxyl carrier protein
VEDQPEGGASVKIGKYTATTEGSTIEVRHISDKLLFIDGKEVEYDLKQLDKSLFSLLLDGKSFLVQLGTSAGSVRPKDKDGNGFAIEPVRVSISGREYFVIVDDERSALLKKFATKSHSGTSAHVMRAPMPGMISRIEVEVGMDVAKGTGLLVLEAMKMENEIRAAGSGRIKAIHVQKGTAVEKDQPLITIDEL